MTSSIYSGLAIALLLLLGKPFLTNGESANPYLPWYFSQVLQTFGLSFFDTTPPLSPPLSSPLRNSSTLSQPSIQDAEYYTLFSFASYCSASSIQSNTCEYCRAAGPDSRFVTLIQDNLYNTLAIITINDARKEIVVTFRGSLNVPNVVEDVLLVPGDPAGPKDVRVHQGFYLATQSIYAPVVDAVKNLTAINANYSIKIVGHSLGGAQAILTLYLIKVKNVFPENSLSLFTYGQPRAGNKAFADFINTLGIPVARVTNRADIAVHGSPALLGYVHHQNELFLDSEKGIQRYCNVGVYEDPTCSNSYGPLYTPVDHLYYFDLQATTCLEADPYNFALQILLPLQSLIPLLSPTPSPTFKPVLGDAIGVPYVKPYLG